MRSQMPTYQNTSLQEIFTLPQDSEEAQDDILTRDELMRSNKELEQFAFLAAHDLQQPLNVISSCAQLLDRKYRGKLDDKADKIILLILESTGGMEKLIKNLLKYSQAGKGDVQFKKVDCAVLLSRAIENLKVNIEENSAHIMFADLPVLKGDEIQLIQLFQNLINNAIKFRKKEETPLIYISVQEKDNQWLFSIQDNGIGIEQKDTQSIFDIFKRLHVQSEYVGNGIGLALCKRIIESHGGRIWVESQTGKGTIVNFILPKM